MARKKQFRMRQKPSQPKRKRGIEQKTCILDSYSEPSVAELMDSLSVLPLDGKVEIEKDYDTYDPGNCYPTLVVTFHVDESDTDFAKRMAQYEKRLASYVEWYEKNADEIKARLREEEQLKEQIKGNEIKKLEQQLAKLKGE